MTLVPLPAFADNYFSMPQGGRDAHGVDPGEAAPVLDAPGRGNLQLAAILVTRHDANQAGFPEQASAVGASAVPGQWKNDFR
jgi:hydroxyacylglutathione hydrolase